MKNLNKIISADYSALYPDVKTFYYTEDGNVFLSESPARDHASKTKQTLKSFGNDRQGKQQSAPVVDITPEEQLQAWVQATDYRSDLALAEALGLDLDNKKHATIVEAISNAKAAMEGGE